MARIRELLGDFILSFLIEVFLALLIGAAIWGLIIGPRWLFYVAGGLFLSLIAAFVVYVIALGVGIPASILRGWRTYSPQEKILYGTIAAVVGFLMLALIAAAITVLIIRP